MKRRKTMMRIMSRLKTIQKRMVSLRKTRFLKTKASLVSTFSKVPAPYFHRDDSFVFRSLFKVSY